MYLPRSRLAVALGMTNATPDQQMFWLPTCLLGSQLHLIFTVASPLNPSILSEAGVMVARVCS